MNNRNRMDSNNWNWKGDIQFVIALVTLADLLARAWGLWP